MNKIIEEYQKCSKNDGEVLNEYFFRPLSFPLVMLAKALKMTPNFVSYIGLVFTILSGVFIALDHLTLAAIFLFLRHIIDNVDGSLARNTQHFSKIGAFLDAFLDTMGFVCIVFGMMIRDFIINQDFLIILWGVAMGLSLPLLTLAYGNFRARYIKHLDLKTRNPHELFCNPDGEEKKLRKKKKTYNLFKIIADFIEKFYQATGPIPDLVIPPEISQERRIKIRAEYMKIYKKTFSFMHKLWSLVGGAVITVLMIVFFALQRVDLVWLSIIVGLNIVLIVLILLQNLFALLFRIKVRDKFGMNLTRLLNPFTGNPIPIPQFSRS